MSRLIVLLLALFPLSIAAAETLYVQSAKAKVMSAPTFQAEVLATAAKGDALEVVETSAQWVKVKFQSHTGWVSALIVAPQPPRDKITIIKDNPEATPNENVRRRASSSSSAAAARGLRQDERARTSDESKANYPALEKMEATQPDENAVEEFRRESER
jgi:uncharacterized protein YgiM (DUF1202 family)